MKCLDCWKDSVVKKEDLAVEDNPLYLIFLWSCPECGQIHKKVTSPLTWEIEE